MFEPLKKLLRENEVNAFLRDCQGIDGLEFVEQVLDHFKCSYSAIGREVDLIPSEGAVVLARAQPLGLLEACALLKLVASVRQDVRVIANDRLLPFGALRPLLVPPEAANVALQSAAALVASGRMPADLDRSARRLAVRVGGPNAALVAGLSAFLRRNATLPIRIGETAASPKAKVIRLRGSAEMPVAHAEDRRLVRRELRESRLLGHAADGKQLFLLDARPDSAVLRELGRLREIAFRKVGEGTGRRRDADAFDAYYRHILLWDDAELQIAGAYRVGEAGRILEERGEQGLYTNSLFSYGDPLRAILPEALELGRSFIQPRYQGLRTLDHLWAGIGAYLAARPGTRYLFGAVSMSASYPLRARSLLALFFGRYFGGAEGLAVSRQPFRVPRQEQAAFAALFDGKDYESGLRILKRELAAMRVSIPVLYRQYAELCEAGGTRFLAFNVDPAFSGCVDALVVVDLARLKPAKRERYLGGAQRLLEPLPLRRSA